MDRGKNTCLKHFAYEIYESMNKYPLIFVYAHTHIDIACLVNIDSDLLPLSLFLYSFAAE